MIPCTEYIAAYNEFYNYLSETKGEQAVEKYWTFNHNRQHDLRDLVREYGIEGCWRYWQHTLNEEAADFTMELDPEAETFRLDMHYCPSKGRLIENQRNLQIDPYPRYCEHCRVYGEILEPLGYDCDLDLSETDQAKCSFTIRKNNSR